MSDGKYGDGIDDPVVREILGLDNPVGAGRADVSGDPDSAGRQPQAGLGFDPLQIATWVAGVVLAVAMNDEEPDVHTPPPRGVEIGVPQLPVHVPLHRAITELGLDAVPPPLGGGAVGGPHGFGAADAPDEPRGFVPAEMLDERRGFVPPGMLAGAPADPRFIVTVPEAVLWNKGAPTPLLGAVADGLTSPEMMAVIRAAIDAVRFGADAGTGTRAAVKHAVEVKTEDGRDVFISEFRPAPGPAYAWCSCGFPKSGPFAAEDALTVAATHLRMEIEEQLRQLQRVGSRAASGDDWQPAR